MSAIDQTSYPEGTRWEVSWASGSEMALPSKTNVYEARTEGAARGLWYHDNGGTSAVLLGVRRLGDRPPVTGSAAPGKIFIPPRDPDPQIAIRTAALNCAVTILGSGESATEDVLTTARDFENYILSGDEDVIYSREPLSEQDFWSAVSEERKRQRDLGYNAAHDRQHGAQHLLGLWRKYAGRGDQIKAAAVIEALHLLLATQPSPIQDRPQA